MATQDESLVYVQAHGTPNKWGHFFLEDGSVAVTSGNNTASLTNRTTPSANLTHPTCVSRPWPAGRLPATFMLHAVGPVWGGGPPTVSNPISEVLAVTVRQRRVRPLRPQPCNNAHSGTAPPRPATRVSLVQVANTFLKAEELKLSSVALPAIR